MSSSPRGALEPQRGHNPECEDTKVHVWQDHSKISMSGRDRVKFGLGSPAAPRFLLKGVQEGMTVSEWSFLSQETLLMKKNIAERPVIS